MPVSPVARGGEERLEAAVALAGTGDKVPNRASIASAELVTEDVVAQEATADQEVSAVLGEMAEPLRW